MLLCAHPYHRAYKEHLSRSRSSCVTAKAFHVAALKSRWRLGRQPRQKHNTNNTNQLGAFRLGAVSVVTHLFYAIPKKALLGNNSKPLTQEKCSNWTDWTDWVLVVRHRLYADGDFSPPLKGDASCFAGCNSVKPRMTHASTSRNGSSSRL